MTESDTPAAPSAKPDPRVGNAYIALRLLAGLRHELKDGNPYLALMRLADFAYQATTGHRAAIGQKVGPESAQKVHVAHVKDKVGPYREEYRKRLKAGERRRDIIATMAKKYDKDGWAKNPARAKKRMRDTIKPRQQRAAAAALVLEPLT